MTNGPRQKPPPLPPPIPKPALPSPAPEPLMKNLPPSIAKTLASHFTPKGPLSVDEGGGVSLDGMAVGRLSGAVLLLEYGAATPRFPIPPSMRLMAESKKYVLFFEISESSVLICSGKTLGQKTFSFPVK